MAYINTVVKRATAASWWSSPCSVAVARPAVMGPTWSRTFASDNSSQEDDVPRTATGEVQKQNNFASEVGKKMQEVAPGGDPAESASSGKRERPKQGRDRSGSK